MTLWPHIPPKRCATSVKQRLMPGFVDLHTHLEYSVFRGVVNDLPYARWKMQVMSKEAALTDEDWRVSALLGAMETVRSGITSIADITNSGACLEHVAAAGLRGVVYREVSTMSKREVPRCDGVRSGRTWTAGSHMSTPVLSPSASRRTHPTLVIRRCSGRLRTACRTLVFLLLCTWQDRVRSSSS